MKVEVLAPVAGSISMMLADEGAVVTEGDDLAEVELMKTMFRVTAPAAGTLHWRYGPGEIVGEGEVIAEIET